MLWKYGLSVVKTNKLITNDDFVAVRSNEVSALDYVVLKLKISCIVQELPLQVSKASPKPGEIVLLSVLDSKFTRAWRFTVPLYPEDLVDWLKSSGSGSSSNIPTPSFESSINFDDAKDLKQIIIALPFVIYKPGLPIFKDLDGQVAGMYSSIVFINRGEEKERFISFAVSMPRIIAVRNPVKPRNGSQTILIKAVERS